MPESKPGRRRQGGGGSSSTGGPSLTTSVYDTRLGPAALSWSRTLFGISLRFILRLDAANGTEEETPLSFRIRPWLFWKRRGSKRIELDATHYAHVSWDLSRARFGLGPEPISGFFVAVSVNGELALVSGDLVDEAYKATKSQKPICISGLKPSILISRREHVEMGESYKSKVRVWGKEREISVNLVGKERGELGLWIGMDGKRVLQVKRLKWKFRGSEKVQIDENNGDKVQISWDLHNWIFPIREPVTGSNEPVRESDSDAIFVFKFEKELGFEEERVSLGGLMGGQFSNCGLNWSNWSESGSSSSKGRKKGKKGNLRKTGSGSSSTSSNSSWASGSTVMDWASVEEFELRKTEGFSLLVHAWKR